MRVIPRLTLILLLLGSLIGVFHVQTYSSPADPRLLFWLVPWGPDNGTYLNLVPYLPKIVVGIVFAFHTYGLGNQSVSLQQALSYDNNGQWISEQLSKLNGIYDNSDVVFVNFFLTTTYWRGYLTNVTPAQLVLLNYTLHQIAQLTDGGQKLVVGVSEMNSLSLNGYLEIYSLIHQVLPNAQLMYYTDLGQSVSSVESVFSYLESNGLALNYLGYDVYPYPSYNYTNGVVYIPTSDVQQITELQSFASQHGANYFIGEVGFRDGDVKGYYYPASTSYIDFNATTGYNLTITYYEDVISQLSSLGINLIGAWDYNGWNGDPFGLWFNPDLSSLLEFVGITPTSATVQEYKVTFMPVNFPNVSWTLYVYNSSGALIYANVLQDNTPVTLYLPVGNYTYVALIGTAASVSGSFYVNSNMTVYLYYTAPTTTATVQEYKVTFMPVNFPNVTWYLYVLNSSGYLVYNNALQGDVQVALYLPAGNYTYYALVGTETLQGSFYVSGNTTVYLYYNVTVPVTTHEYQVKLVPVNFPNVTWYLYVLNSSGYLVYNNALQGDVQVALYLPAGNYTYYALVGTETLQGSFYVSGNTTVYLYYNSTTTTTAYINGNKG